MKEYILLFRADYSDLASVSHEETRERNNRWMDWTDDLVDKNHLVEGGNHLNPEGKVLFGNGVITDGPFRENKESVLGYILILADSLVNAVELAQTCPILAGEGTSVEVREIGTL
jgi:hypothetical protein